MRTYSLVVVCSGFELCEFADIPAIPDNKAEFPRVPQIGILIPWFRVKLIDAIFTS